MPGFEARLYCELVDSHDELTNLGLLRPGRRRILLPTAATNAPINFPASFPDCPAKS
jgi:hypothetical protein